MHFSLRILMIAVFDWEHLIKNRTIKKKTRPADGPGHFGQIWTPATRLPLTMHLDPI